MLMKSTLVVAILAAASFAALDPAQAQGRRYGGGPVASLCAADISAYCAGLPHGNRAVRNCLNRHRADVSQSCRSALDNTGGGRGMGRGWR
jgi:hypothetical protein